MYSMIRHCTKQVPAFGESRCRNCAYGQGYLGRNEKYLGMGLRWRFDDVEVEGMIEHRTKELLDTKKNWNRIEL
jgi:hypothetical protein